MRKQRRGGFTALDADDRQPLEKLVAAHKRPARTQLRARIVLRNADGIGTQPVADELGVHRLTVRKWRTHYLEHGIDDPLQDRPRLGQPGPISAGRYLVIQTFPVRRPAPNPPAHWTVRAAAVRLNVSPSTVHRVWRRHKIRPHGRDSFRVAEYEEFEPKTRAPVRLRLRHLAARDVVLSFDKRPSIPTRDRTQPNLPLYPGRRRTLTHGDKRHGCTHLQTWQDLRTGQIYAHTTRRNWSEDFIRDMNVVLGQLPPGARVHIVLDNALSHECKRTRAWLRRHPQVTFYGTPISCSSLNPMEGFLSILTRRCLKDGTFRSVDELVRQHRRLLDTLRTAQAEATC